MKVRCINNELIIYGQLSVGEVYEVQGENLLRYYLTDDLGRDIFFNKERFEIVEEDNNMQKKTFREVIADIKEGEVWESHCKKIIGFKDGDFEIRDNDGHKFGNAVSIRSANKYRLKRKECNFEEAFKAFEVGKEIESCITNDKFKKADSYNWKFKAPYMDEYSDDISNEIEMFSVEEIRGKWYINN